MLLGKQIFFLFHQSKSIYLENTKVIRVIRTAILSLAFNFQSALHLDIPVTEKEADGSISAASSSVKWISVWKIKINGLHNHFVLLKPIWMKGKKRVYIWKYLWYLWIKINIVHEFELMHKLPFYFLPYLCESWLEYAQRISGCSLSNCHLKDVQEMVWENMKCGSLWVCDFRIPCTHWSFSR